MEKNLVVIDEREVLGKEFKIYGDFENPLFKASDVANWIEHSNVSRMLESIDENEKVLARHNTTSATFLTEDGLYEVLMQSRKPIAKAFKREVKQILKTIRLNGMYATDKLLDNPDLAIQVFTQLKVEREKRKELEYDNQIKTQQIAELKPMKDYVDTILSSDDTMTITQIGADYGKSAKELNKLLHEQGLIRNVGGQWILYKEHMNKGYTKSETVPIKRKDGTEKIVLNTKWTQKGRLKIHEILTVLGIKANQDKENEKKFKSSDDIHLGIFYYKKIKVR